jgi:hypothetical protein
MSQEGHACRDETALFILNGAMIQDFKVALGRFVRRRGLRRLP